jgi:TrmH family RNA methyltransferase
VAEGPEVIRAGIDAGVHLDALYVAAGGRAHDAVRELADRVHDEGGRVFDLAPGVLEKVADTVTPQPVLAVFAMVDRGIDELSGHGLVVACTDLRDPGNAGTVLRSADAAGAEAVVCTGGTVDPYNPKAVRASAGSLFHVPLVCEPSVAVALESIGSAGYRLLGASAGGGEDYLTVDFSRPTALVLGNEAWGLAPEVEQALDGMVHVPMAGRAESLNVGMAAAVLCFEALRQRRQRGDLPGRTDVPPTMPPVRSDP